MEHSRLPIELCERVIDCVRKTYPWWDRGQLVSKISTYWDDQDSLPDLLACAWTCSAWYPRARLNIYHTVTFNHLRQIELFVRSLRENPLLADRVHELIINFLGEYIPFAQGMLFSALRNVHTVVLPLLDVHNWVYPPHHHVLVTQFNLTELILTINASRTSSLVYAFRIVWSLRRLRSLFVMFSGGAPVVTDSLVRNLHSLRRQWSCEKLTTLTIKGFFMLHTMAILPSCPFGMAIEQLALDIVQPSSRDYTKSSALREQISILRSLRELRVWITDNNTEWESMSTILPFVLDTLPSPEILREVHVIVYKNSMPSERIHFLASVSKGKLDDTLRRFPKLSLLYFEFIEIPDSGYDGTWWEEQLLDHMPGLRGILPVTAKIIRSPYSPGWREDQPLWFSKLQADHSWSKSAAVSSHG